MRKSMVKLAEIVFFSDISIMEYYIGLLLGPLNWILIVLFRNTPLAYLCCFWACGHMALCGHIWPKQPFLAIWPYGKMRNKRRQVTYPWKEHSKHRLPVLTEGFYDTQKWKYLQKTFLANFPIDFPIDRGKKVERHFYWSTIDSGKC